MESKKSVLILSPDRPDNPMGGLGVHLSEIMKRFDTTVFNITAICLGQDEDKVLENGVMVYGVNPYFSVTRSQDSIARTFLLQSALCAKALSLLSQRKMRKPDLVHIMDWSTGIAGIDIAAATGAKPVFAVHLSIGNSITAIHPSQQSNWDEAKQIEFYCCQKAYAVLHVSTQYSKLYPFNFFSHKNFIVPNGVCVSDYEQTDGGILPGNNRIKILYVGRVAPMKNVDTLMKLNLPADCDMIFMGGRNGSSESMIQNLKDICSKEENKFYVGELYGERKIAMMKAADLIIMPSRHEPFGMVALEAMACGCNGKTLLVSSFVDGLGSFLSDEFALRCGTSAQSIGYCIRRFLRMPADKRKEMALKAHSAALGYDWQNTVDKIETIYKQILNIQNNE